MSDLTLQQLRMLREVAELGTVAAAAESLGYTPSAVSQQLAGLERAVGRPVFERVGRNLRLTDAGRVLVEHAIALLDGVEAARVAMERVDGEVRGTFRLSVFESVASTLLPAVLRLLADQHPDLDLRTRQLEPEAAIEMVASGELDMAFTIDYPHAPVARRDDIVRVPVATDVFRLAVPVDEPVDGPVVRLADLGAIARRGVIAESPASGCGRCIQLACRAAGFEPDLAHEISDYATSLRLVAGGHGIALLPDLALEDVPASVRIVGIEPPFSRNIELAHRRVSAQRPAVVAVLDAVAEVVRRRRARPRLVG